MSKESKTWVSSDLHFFHKNILKHCASTRPFADVEEMHNAILENWNSKIAPHDTVYILGDVSFGKATKTAEIINQLNGNKILVMGNHDRGYMNKPAFISCFSSVHKILELKYKGYSIIMFHHPIAFWEDSSRGSFMLHGHLHGFPSNLTGRIKDIGMDTNNCTPYLLDEVITELLQIGPIEHH